MNIVRYQSANFGSRQGWKPDRIVCHITEGAFDGACEWLCGGASGVSAHFVVGRDGRIAQLVDLINAAYCNGTQSGNPFGYEFVGRATAQLVKARRVNANLYTVSIECEGWTRSTHGILTDAQFAALAWLIGYIKQQVKIFFGADIPCDRAHLLGHNEIAPKEKPDCPGRDFPWDKLISALNRPVPITHFDMPGAAVSGAFDAGGWAISPAGIMRVDLYADAGKPDQTGLASVRELGYRPDVAKAYPQYPNGSESGWRATVRTGTLAPGTHTLDAAAIGNDGSVCWAHKKIAVK